MIYPNHIDLIIHHRDCPDGFCAAFVAKQRYSKAELLAVNHGEAMKPDVTDKNVLVVDFSWRTREENIELANQANWFAILDHHKTAAEVLSDLEFVVFDMNRSGAGITWDELFPGWTRPWYVNYVEDRDLWRHKLYCSREINAYLSLFPYRYDDWMELERIDGADAAIRGHFIVKHINQYVERVLQHTQVGTLNGFTCGIVNAPYMMISEVGNALAKKYEIGLGWFERGDGMMNFSLRSEGDRDVSRIAQSFGGGGHKNAAGFQKTITEGRALIDSILNRRG